MKTTTQIMVLCILASLPCMSQIQNLVDMGDGTIYDPTTNLMWLKNAKSATSKTYTEAWSWAENLVFPSPGAAYDDWRLPIGTDPSTDPSRTTDDGMYYYNCLNSEFGYLFYTICNGCSGHRLDETCMPYYPFVIDNEDPDPDLFENMSCVPVNSCKYWTDIPDGANKHWTFGINNGVYVSQESDPSSNYRLSAWAVRDAGELEIGNGIVLVHDLSGSMSMAYDVLLPSTRFR